MILSLCLEPDEHFDIFYPILPPAITELGYVVRLKILSTL